MHIITNKSIINIEKNTTLSTTLLLNLHFYKFVYILYSFMFNKNGNDVNIYSPLSCTFNEADTLLLYVYIEDIQDKSQKC